jgi:hypothetical protein
MHAKSNTGDIHDRSSVSLQERRELRTEKSLEQPHDIQLQEERVSVPHRSILKQPISDDQLH